MKYPSSVDELTQLLGKQATIARQNLERATEVNRELESLRQQAREHPAPAPAEATSHVPPDAGRRRHTEPNRTEPTPRRPVPKPGFLPTTC